MVWLTALGCLVAGAILGAVLYKIFKSDEVKIHRLEAQIQQLTEEYSRYKKDVHNHFSDSAQLVANLTQSYQEVYQHLAQGAQTLCPEHIAKQITTVAPALLAELPHPTEAQQAKLLPPLDYVAPTPHDSHSSTSRTTDDARFGLSSN
jgi:uncharacterized protein